MYARSFNPTKADAKIILMPKKHERSAKGIEGELNGPIKRVFDFEGSKAPKSELIKTYYPESLVDHDLLEKLLSLQSLILANEDLDLDFHVDSNDTIEGVYEKALKRLNKKGLHFDSYFEVMTSIEDKGNIDYCDYNHVPIVGVVDLHKESYADYAAAMSVLASLSLIGIDTIYDYMPYSLFDREYGIDEDTIDRDTIDRESGQYLHRMNTYLGFEDIRRFSCDIPTAFSRARRVGNAKWRSWLVRLLGIIVELKGNGFNMLDGIYAHIDENDYYQSNLDPCLVNTLIWSSDDFYQENYMESVCEEINNTSNIAIDYVGTIYTHDGFRTCSKQHVYQKSKLMNHLWSIPCLKIN